MHPPPLSTPLSAPTQIQLVHARTLLVDQLATADSLQSQILAAQAHLAQIIRDSQAVIDDLQNKLGKAEKDIEQTKGVLAPIRRLPDELLRAVFLIAFHADPKCGWVLSSVSARWRVIALRTPRLWTRIRLQTSFDSSPEIIRLWLERSGDRLPLDIEIFAKVGDQAVGPNSNGQGRRRWRTSSTAAMLMAGWNVTHHGSQQQQHDVSLPPPPPPPLVQSHLTSNASSSRHSSCAPSSSTSTSTSTSTSSSRTAPHWAHMAVFYLTEHIQRWERFVFRFDRMFASAAALRSISSEIALPQLKEFEVSCAEVTSSWGSMAGPSHHPPHGPYGGGHLPVSGDWGVSGGPGIAWLPSAAMCPPVTSANHKQKSTLPSVAAAFYPSLTRVTLQHVPFGYTAGLLTHSHLRSLTLRSVPSHNLALHRLLNLLSANPSLEHLHLHFSGLSQPMLPLEPTTLSKLQSLTLGGAFLLNQLLDALRLPALQSLTLDIDPRDGFEDAIINLLARSSSPKLSFLSLAYNYATTQVGSAHNIMYNVLLPFSSNFVNNALRDVEELRVGMTSFECLVGLLGAPPGSHIHGTGIVAPIDLDGDGDNDDALPMLGSVPFPGPGAGPNTGTNGGSTHLNGWACPKLKRLAMRNCSLNHPHAIDKLIKMVEKRNPPGTSSSASSSSASASSSSLDGPARLTSLTLIDCTPTMGSDIVNWLASRIPSVRLVEPDLSSSKTSSSCSASSGCLVSGCPGTHSWPISNPWIASPPFNSSWLNAPPGLGGGGGGPPEEIVW